MYLYVYRGFTGGRAASEDLVRKALRQYTAETRPASAADESPAEAAKEKASEKDGCAAAAGCGGGKPLFEGNAGFGGADLPGAARCPEILRTEKGKPYFPDSNIEFSVSHTGDLWVCLMGTAALGIDVQEMRRNSWEKIAQRYYTDDEQEEVRKKGRDAFYRIWTRKEAFAKYTGKGLNSGLKTFSTLKKQDVWFAELNLAPNTKCSCCMKEKEEIWIRNLV